jgi:hypothetical protein
MRLRSGICTGSERCVWHEMQDQTVSSSAVGRVLKGAKPVDLPILILHLATIEAHRALSPCDFEILCRGFSSVRDFLVFDCLTLIQSAQTRALDG